MAPDLDPSSRISIRMSFFIGLLSLLGFGYLALLLTTRGRKSGTLRHTPSGLFNLGPGYGNRLVSEHPSASGDVYAQVGFHRFHIRAELVQDPEELSRMMKWLAAHHTSGMAGRAMGWDPKRDDLQTADFSGMFKGMAIVRFREQT